MSIADLYPPMRGIANMPWYTLIPRSVVSRLSTRVSVAADATPHTKGAWVEIIASAEAEIGLLLVEVTGLHVSGSETSALIDIGTGTAGNEVAVAENVAVGGAQAVGTGTTPGIVFALPARIPAGTRIAARLQALIASDSANVGVQGFALPSLAGLGTDCDVLGTDTATSRGTPLSGASGSWTEIVASTARRYRALVIVPSVPVATVTTGRTPTLTAGVGPAGSEVSAGSIVYSTDTLERANSLVSDSIMPLIADIPTGSRIAVRHDLANNPQQFAVTVIGVP